MGQFIVFTSGDRSPDQSEQLKKSRPMNDEGLLNRKLNRTHLSLLPVGANCCHGDASLWAQWVDRQIAAPWSSPTSRLYSCHDVRGHPGEETARVGSMSAIQHRHGEPCREPFREL